MINDDIDITLSRYFSGETTKKDLHTLDLWLTQSNENEQYFQQMSLLYQRVGQILPPKTINTEKALSEFKNYIEKKRKNISLARRTFFFKPMAVAAAVAVLLICGFVLFNFLHQPPKTIQLAAGNDIAKFKIFENANVTLFSGAEIVYDATKNNAIQLKGKADFHVFSKNNGSAKNVKGIVIQAGETYIKNIGTIFTVDATQPDRFITVEVSDGEVKFYTKLDKGVHLKQNESATYNVETKEFNIVNASHVASPQQQDIIFQNTPLHEAINIIKARYGIDILISSERLKNIPLNASFDKNESVDDVLYIVTESVSAHLSKKGDVYIITPL